MTIPLRYIHLEVELVTDAASGFHFKYVEDLANRYELELSDDDFRRLHKLAWRGSDVEWIIRSIAMFNAELVDVLISYMSYDN